MAKVKVHPPPHVHAAILRGDTEAILRFAYTGGQANKRRLAKLKKATEARQVSQGAIIDECLAVYHRQVLIRDAHAHHMRNLAGVSQD